MRKPGHRVWLGPDVVHAGRVSGTDICQHTFLLMATACHHREDHTQKRRRCFGGLRPLVPWRLLLLLTQMPGLPDGAAWLSLGSGSGLS